MLHKTDGDRGYVLIVGETPHKQRSKNLASIFSGVWPIVIMAAPQAMLLVDIRGGGLILIVEKISFAICARYSCRVLMWYGQLDTKSYLAQ